MPSISFEQGKQAAREGQGRSANPHIIGTTKLGAPRLSEEGVEWERGWIEGQPRRLASKKEMEAAAELDVSRFRRRSNRYYR